MKSKDLRELTDEELEQELFERQEELFHLRIQHGTTPADNPLRLRHLRREIARIMTITKERQSAALA